MVLKNLIKVGIQKLLKVFEQKNIRIKMVLQKDLILFSAQFFILLDSSYGVILAAWVCYLGITFYKSLYKSEVG